MEDRRSRLQRAAAGLEDSDRPHRWPTTNIIAPAMAAGEPSGSILAPAIVSGLDRRGVSPLSRDFGNGFNSLTPHRHQNGTRSLLHGATYLSKKRCAGNRLARRGSQSLYLAIATAVPITVAHTSYDPINVTIRPTDKIRTTKPTTKPNPTMRTQLK